MISIKKPWKFRHIGCAAAVLAGMTVMTGMLTFGAQTTTTKTKAVYSYTTKKKTKSYTDQSKIKVEWSYRMPVLAGRSAAVKKINTAINKNYSATKKDFTTLKSYAKDDCKRSGVRNGATYYRRTKAKVTYNKNGIFSVHYTHTWFAGGISNTWSTGETYSLKTGKRLTVTNVLKGTTSGIRNKISTAYTIAYPSASASQISTLRKQKLSSLNFFRTGNRICICLPTEYGTTGDGIDVYLKI